MAPFEAPKDPIFLDDPDDSRLAPFLSRRLGAPESNELVMLDGPKLVERYHCEVGPLTAILARPEFYERNPHLRSAFRYAVSKAFLTDVIGFKYHQGVIGAAPKPRDVSLEEAGPRVAILSGLTDAENVGAVARLCDGFGFDTMIVDAETCSPLVRRAVRVSMGSVFRLKVRHAADLVADLKALRAKEYQVWGAALGGQRLDRSGPIPKHLALVLGSEGTGISEAVLKHCTASVTIPMTAAIDSLNVSHAAAILMHEVFTARG